VVVVCDNIFNFHHETTRSSRGGCVGNLFLFLPGDHEIFSWCISATAFFSFTRRPRDFLVVGLCDNISNFHHETMYYQITMYYCIILWTIIVKFTTRRRAPRDNLAYKGQCWNCLSSAVVKPALWCKECSKMSVLLPDSNTMTVPRIYL